MFRRRGERPRGPAAPRVGHPVQHPEREPGQEQNHDPGDLPQGHRGSV